MTPVPAVSALPVRTQHTRPGPVISDRSIVLDATDAAARAARATLRQCLNQWQLRHLQDDAELILDELVVNAVNASRQAAPQGQAPAAITVKIALERGQVVLQAWDPDPTPPPDDYTPGTWDESGRGLLIIKALARQWGTSPGTNGGKHVHATLPTTQPPARHQPEGTPLKAPDDHLAQLQARHAARWDIWLIRSSTRNRWCTKPAGTATGIHDEDSADALEAWIHRVDALTDSGITIAFQPGHTITATATWTSPGSRTPTTHGPAEVPDVLDHAEDIRARRAGLIEWLNRDPEATARHMSDAQIEDLIPHVASNDARRVLEAIVVQHSASRRETYLNRSLPPTSPFAILFDEADDEQAASVPSAT